MFITVLHGENKADLFNTHCKVQLLLEGIKHCCGCEEEDEIELADENGQVKNLLQNKHRCATELLVERETYVLLGVTGGGRPSEKIYTPLLKDENIINSKFLAKLEAWQDHKAPSPRIKARRTNKKSNLDVPAAEGEPIIRKKNPPVPILLHNITKCYIFEKYGSQPCFSPEMAGLASSSDST
ncbi:hypothetical protein JRQ81_010760 [Phrynocephalus forsythii]|uniref:Uncharacterized protein n=1 Tax=Phrynocephalus forsythii TaxID=171643 RepID=A0A9Q0X7H4_9SAUR|nr:hypothetical protein JRQ81_010760 [Phrynocephalus forsythii]